MARQLTRSHPGAFPCHAGAWPSAKRAPRTGTAARRRASGFRPAAPPAPTESVSSARPRWWMPAAAQRGVMCAQALNALSCTLRILRPGRALHPSLQCAGAATWTAVALCSILSCSYQDTHMQPHACASLCETANLPTHSNPFALALSPSSVWTPRGDCPWQAHRTPSLERCHAWRAAGVQNWVYHPSRVRCRAAPPVTPTTPPARRHSRKSAMRR